MDDSGVRRSCETAAKIAIRSSFPSWSSAASSASRSSSRSRTATASCAANADSTRLALAGRLAPLRTRVASGPSSMASTPSSGRSGGDAPAEASTSHSSPERRITDTAVSPNVVRRCSTRCGKGSSSDMSHPASRASASASARPRWASDRSRAARSTRTLTTTATSTNTTMPNRFSGSEIVQVWMGGVKYQFARSDAATAATTAGHSPPSAAMPITTDR
jgi:hypothetical protein